METKANKTNRLGTESIPRLLFSIAMPTVMAQLVNLLYNVVDRAFVGHIAGTGSLALAGLGICFPITLMLSALAVMVGMGGAPRAAIAMGEKNYGKAEHILGNCASLAIIFSVLSLVGFELVCDPLLTVAGAKADVLPYASAYMRIYLIGTPFMMATMGLNGFITNQGFAKTSMATICIGAVLNIILDPIFIFALDMGVRGAAYATVIAQGASAIWVLVFLCGKHGSIHIRLSEMRLDMQTVIVIVSLGMSPFIMNATECVVQLTYNICISQYGGLYVALQSILFTLISIIWMPMSGFAQGAGPIISFNYGAQQLPRARQTFKLLLIVDMIFAIGVVTLIELFPTAVLSVFTNDASLIALGATPLRVYIFGFYLMGAQSACQQTFLSLGQAKISMFLASLRKLFLIWPLALILPHLWGLGVWGLFIAEPVADLIAGTVTYITFRVKSRKLLY